MKFLDKSYIRPDVVFSNWIFVFAIIYFIGFKKYNPRLLLIIGLFHNVILFFIYLKLKKIKWAWLLALVNFCIKAVPIYFLRTTTITWNDAYFSFILFLIYLIYINILYYVFKVESAYSMFNSEEMRPGIFMFYINKLLKL